MLLGCENVFGDVPDIVKSLLGIEVSESQVYRTCQAVSSQLLDTELDSPNEDLLSIVEDVSRQVYGMVDGSMLATDDGWQETKVGRVFSATLLGSSEVLKWQMGTSQYVAHRGHYEAFTEKFERLLPPNSSSEKVFITDGALWIGKWLWQTYPQATHILDFFHVCEKLSMAAQRAKNPALWLKEQKEYLLEGQHKKVYKAVEELGNKTTDEQRQLLNYLKVNAYRMQYDEYRQKGFMISSGPIESAHRTVLQVRMKRSGQRWSNGGCDNMIKLRVAYRSQKFFLVTDILKKMSA